MKAHVVKGLVLALVFLLAARFCEAARRARLVGQSSSRFSSLWLLSFVLERLAMFFRRESCIRRGIRHEPVPIGCRIHPEV